MKNMGYLFWAGIGGDIELRRHETIERLKAEAETDFSETCFAGKGRMGKGHLTPDPEYSEQLRHQDYL